jgi:hypothetical protein
MLEFVWCPCHPALPPAPSKMHVAYYHMFAGLHHWFWAPWAHILAIDCMSWTSPGLNEKINWEVLCGNCCYHYRVVIIWGNPFLLNLNSKQPGSKTKFLWLTPSPILHSADLLCCHRYTDSDNAVLHSVEACILMSNSLLLRLSWVRILTIHGGVRFQAFPKPFKFSRQADFRTLCSPRKQACPWRICLQNLVLLKKVYWEHLRALEAARERNTLPWENVLVFVYFKYKVQDQNHS